MPGIEKSLHEFKRGKLKSSSGAKVTNRKQAIAIGLSEARKGGSDSSTPKNSYGPKESKARKKIGNRPF